MSDVAALGSVAGSFGYTSDGSVLWGDTTSTLVQPAKDRAWSPGDTLGAGIDFNNKIAYFTRNGTIVYEKEAFDVTKKTNFAVSFDTAGQSVRVTFGPRFQFDTSVMAASDADLDVVLGSGAVVGDRHAVSAPSMTHLAPSVVPLIVDGANCVVSTVCLETSTAKAGVVYVLKSVPDAKQLAQLTAAAAALTDEKIAAIAVARPRDLKLDQMQPAFGFVAADVRCGVTFCFCLLTAHYSFDASRCAGHQRRRLCWHARNTLAHGRRSNEGCDCEAR